MARVFCITFVCLRYLCGKRKWSEADCMTNFVENNVRPRRISKRFIVDRKQQYL